MANNPTEEIISKFGTQWKFLSIIAGFASVTISMGTIERHRKEKRTELLALHGLSIDKQLFAISIGNAFVSMILSTILALVLILIILFESSNKFNRIYYCIYYLFNSTGMIALIVSVLNMFLPSIVSYNFRVFIVIIDLFIKLFKECY